MSGIVQHNLSAMNANRMLNVTTKAQAKSTEKLSSGYKINRAADDAAGLSISEKMRSQIRGLNKASSNAQDGISLIQTAEGALGESHSILQRMRELSVQAANGTETADDREAVNNEITQLKEELDRIAETTEFNTMKLLDGSQAGGSSKVTSAGPSYGKYDEGLKAFVSSDASKVTVATTTTAKAGGESAIWNSAGTKLTINLALGKTYSQSEMDNLIANAKQEDSTATSSPSNISVKFSTGSYTATASTTGVQLEKGVRASSSINITTMTGTGVQKAGVGSYIGATSIKITANNFGSDCNVKINIKFDAEAGQDGAKLGTAATYTSTGKVDQKGEYDLHLQAGKEYTASDIEKLLAQAGFSATVELSAAAPDGKDTLYCTNKNVAGTIELKNGAGLGDTDAYLGQAKYGSGSGSGKGITLQIGANEGQTMSFGINDMSAGALGVTAIDLSNQAGAQKAMTTVDEAIKKVSSQRSLLGAVQNRLEHTISNLDTAAENTQNAESNIRDTDMAKEMVEFSKNNILAQAGQSMLAQANQSNQGVLSLLG